MYKKSLVVLSALLVSACATSFEPTNYYNGIHVINDSDETLGSVMVDDLEYGRNFSCGDIAPRGVCTLRFEQRRYQQNPVRVDWSFGDSARQSEEVQFRVPMTFVRSITMRGIVTIASDGSLSTFAAQNSTL